MTELSGAATLTAALLAGIASSAHCVAMCGGLAGALNMSAGATPGRFATLRNAALHNVGRLTGYAIAGALVALLGSRLQSMLNIPLLIVIARTAAGVVLALIALRILFGWNTLAAIERLGTHFWKRIQPLVRRVASRRTYGRSLLLGLLWGWLPCGLVYSMLLLAALSQNASTGATIMLSFGIGTAPALLGSSVFLTRLTQRFRRQSGRQVIGALLLMYGIWVGLAGVTSNHHNGHTMHHTANGRIH